MRGTKKIVAIALFGAISLVLMWFPKFPLLPAVPFMTYDFSDVPVLIGGFSLGPVPAIAIATVKNVLYFFTRSRSGPIGSIMNWTTTVVFVFVASYFYHRIKRDRWGALAGMAIGTLLFTAVGIVMNIYVALPIWGIPTEQIGEMVATAVLPFNLLRGLISTVATMLLYRKTADLIRNQLKL